MIKLTAKYNEDKNELDWKYNAKRTHALEHLCVIWNLIDIVLEKTPDITEKELLNMIKNRKKYIEEIGGEK